jgi:hypothetical protein
MAADLINAFVLCVVVVGCQWRRWMEYLLHLAIVVRLQLQLLGLSFFSDFLFLRVLASAPQALQR